MLTSVLFGAMIGQLVAATLANKFGAPSTTSRPRFQKRPLNISGYPRYPPGMVGVYMCEYGITLHCGCVCKRGRARSIIFSAGFYSASTPLPGHRLTLTRAAGRRPTTFVGEALVFSFGLCHVFVSDVRALAPHSLLS